MWVVDPETGSLSFRHVAVGRYTDRGAYVHGDIADEDVIVVVGAQKLDRNMKVRMAASSPEAAQ